LKIRQCLRPAKFDPQKTRFELHTFTDASERAYAAVVYLRSECDGIVDVNLVTARTKVAPLKQQTIPRLELLGAVLSFRFALRVKEATREEISAVTWWTDSSTVLHWLKDETAFYHSYIASRKELILSGSTADQWRHVPGRLNPADDGTKGAKKLDGAHRWFKGPSFLREDSRLWPDSKKSKAAAE
jgi:hypothetical protein